MIIQIKVYLYRSKLTLEGSPAGIELRFKAPSGILRTGYDFASGHTKVS